MTAPGAEAEARASIDALIKAFFAAFDNRAGNAPNRERFNALFARHAVVASHGATGVVVCGPDEFLSPRIELLSSRRLLNFHEWESEAQTDVFGSLAIRRSRYAKSGVLEGKPYGGSGTKYFQLARTADGWRVVALSWIDDAVAA